MANMPISAIPKNGKMALIIGVLGMYQKCTDKLAIWAKLMLIWHIPRHMLKHVPEHLPRHVPQNRQPNP